MDATRRGFLLVLGWSVAVVAAGCAQQGKVDNPSINGQSCTGQVKQNSYLVKWKDSVPQEYSAKRIYPQSLITRFDNVQEDYIENEVLKHHTGQFVRAEHEFYLTQEIETNPIATSTTTCSTVSLPQAWAVDDIQTRDAWTTLGKKGDGVIVAVIDSGADITHPLLSSQIWTNTHETLNGVDDDGNGLIDDIHGWDFNGNKSDVSDLANHGTHVSGIIAGQAGVNGFTGIAPQAQIMPLKFIDGQGLGSVTDAITAMDYAVKNGAKVINASWGGPQCSTLLQEDIATATRAGTVFANAAGNDHLDINQSPEWPASFQLLGKITVGAYNSQEILSVFSNYGILVDLAAPGEKILSTVPPDPGAVEGSGKLCDKSGTSMATPFVSAVAALLISAKPTLTPDQVVTAINSSVIPGQFGVRTQGRLNALKAAQWVMSH